MTTKKRYEIVLETLSSLNPEPQGELRYADPFQLLVAVMLSAQCTDKRVNMVTPALFDAYPTPAAMAAATVEEVLTYIRSVSYPNAKAAHLVAMARQLIDRFGGQVPDTIESLTSLPGVGRKTANVVCAIIWSQPTMAVDTHIFRVANRIGLVKNSSPKVGEVPVGGRSMTSASLLQTERTLVKYIPADLIPKAHHWLLLHGRYICTARNPHCDRCPIAAACLYYQTLNN